MGRSRTMCGRTKKGYFWAIARDDRPWGGTDPPAVTYSYAPGRGTVHALKLLEHYRGIVQCDGYAAYGAHLKWQILNAAGNVYRSGIATEREARLVCQQTTENLAPGWEAEQ